jgi:hypothetical protein
MSKVPQVVPGKSKQKVLNGWLREAFNSTSVAAGGREERCENGGNRKLLEQLKAENNDLRNRAVDLALEVQALRKRS